MFQFKQFAVRDEASAMKVGTDGVLLGAWASVEGVRRAVDVGAGCGLIALMLAQRAPEATILGVDIDEACIDEARDNFAQSPWADRLEARAADFTTIDDIPAESIDLVVSNPPFFTAGVLPLSPGRQRARHADTLTLPLLISRAARLLTPQGRLAIIVPTQMGRQPAIQATLAGLHVQRVTHVHTTPTAVAKRTLWEFSRLVPSHPVDPQSLTIADTPGHYTPAYLSLTGDFYL